MSDRPHRRRSGLLIPLFSCASSTSWGIGDIGDLGDVTAWLAAAGQSVLQLLPLNEMAPGQQSPYSAISAMAIDPIYIRVTDVPECAEAGGESSLGSEDQARLAAVRRAPCVDYPNVRRLKHVALRAAFERFKAAEWDCHTARAREFGRFLSEQAWWVEDYALFRAIHAHEGERPWTMWPAALQQRDPAAIDRARRELVREVLFYQFLQWIAASQWQAARAHAHGVALFGDLPFMVDTDSADVWARRHFFQLDASLGVPPDAFSATGQDWGMPVYRWDAMAAEDYRWLRERARRTADLFDGYRVDHLVGFYRTYGRPRNGGEPFFTPADEASQTALGERLLDIFKGPGSEIVAEDLGTVPNFVRASLARVGVPGFRVFRWERYWEAEGQPFRDPEGYPVRSVATSGTHDTETMAVWWEQAPEDERRRVAALPIVQRLTDGADLPASCGPVVRDLLLETLFASASELALFPVQDVFGWRDRINEPATVNNGNWTFRLPWPVDRLHEVADARERQDRLRRWAEQYERR